MNNVNEQQSRDEERIGWGRIICISLVAYIALLLGVVGVGRFFAAEKPALLGDYFGGIANILAMFGVVIALVMQRKELQLQRLELRETRRELKGQKEQLKAQVELTKEELRLRFGPSIRVSLSESTTRTAMGVNA